MKSNKLLFLLCCVLNCTCGYAQNNRVWNNKKCAVVLTYDDALNIHLDKVIPALDSQGFKGTFYLIASRPAFTDRMEEWRLAARHGHELGNHTLFHPCTGKLPGREWVQPEYDLSTYTIQRMEDEIRVTNSLLRSVDGKTKRTLGCPCGDTRIGDSTYLHTIKDEFIAFRDGTPEAVALNRFGNFTMNGFAPNGQSGEELIAMVKKAMQDNAMFVFVFHGVGGEHNLNVSAAAHSRLLQFLKQHESEIWVAPFVEVAEFMQQHRASANADDK